MSSGSIENRKATLENSRLHVGLVIMDGCYLSSMAGVMDSFQVANAHVRNQQGEQAPQITWEILSINTGPVNVSGGLFLHADSFVGNTSKFDIVFLSAFPYQGVDAFEDMAQDLQPMFKWIIEQWQSGAVIAAGCTGVFFLAEAGLLDGREATTTWWLERPFRHRYPKVQLDSKAALTSSDRLICAGAMTANYKLTTHILKHYFCPDSAFSGTSAYF